MSTTITITWNHYVDGTLTALAAVPKLSDVGAAFGVKNTSSGVVIVQDAKDMTASATTGVYTYGTIAVDTTQVANVGATDGTCAYNTQYTYAVEYVENGETHRAEFLFTTPAAPSTTRGTAAWACDEVEAYTGITTAADALKHVQAGFDRVVAGQHPEQPTIVRAWSWTKNYREITLAAFAENTCTGVFTGTSLALTATSAFFAGTTADVGRYVEIEDVGTYRITAHSSTTVATCTAATGQSTTGFGTAVACWFAPIMDLPADFGGLNGEVLHVYSDTYDSPRLVMVTADQMMRLWRDDNDDDEGVLYYAIVPKLANSAAAQAYQLWWFPAQTYARRMRYRCHIEGGALTDSSSVYFPGGPKWYDLFLQAALAHAELYQKRVFNGPHEQLFKVKMMEAISLDKALYDNQGFDSMADAEAEIYRV